MIYRIWVTASKYEELQDAIKKDSSKVWFEVYTDLSSMLLDPRRQDSQSLFTSTVKLSWVPTIIESLTWYTFVNCKWERLNREEAEAWVMEKVLHEANSISA